MVTCHVTIVQCTRHKPKSFDVYQSLGKISLTERFNAQLLFGENGCYSYLTSFFFSLFICASTSYQSCAIHIYLVELVMLNVQSQCLSSHGHHHLCGFVIFNRSDKMHFFCSFWQNQRLLATYDNQIQKAPRNSEVISQHQR